ncbi:hypothetical protein SMACR_06866 [Sordaria macrospora]|uniref:WGS project CABT00000000 data, contig 2.38 n=2 Tax=Sordaria macrospora TaxID=5147 RepID=F7W778_SORMK|nr:uncharacterized protein SMAC_06866 [Sordaria macrospora k-hell]KAA8633671.1 hypothetical protein SMACR_06866 [Sordaria macrospora]KAH7634032.1 hypothetical protein B0T09DRAFT_355887 [Sordaria sp. MPI-SDFR-AT-0083]WPJ59614.1 hypothetical protein SMAC4_06866 [Sordaria macrospora]CCC13369.1 unnamed protein product [Sordaria macrospora k-hell]
MFVTHEGPRSPSQEPISANQSGLREDINKQEQLVDGKGPGVSPVSTRKMANQATTNMNSGPQGQQDRWAALRARLRARDVEEHHIETIVAALDNAARWKPKGVASGGLVLGSGLGLGMVWLASRVGRRRGPPPRTSPVSRWTPRRTQKSQRSVGSETAMAHYRSPDDDVWCVLCIKGLHRIIPRAVHDHASFCAAFDEARAAA